MEIRSYLPLFATHTCGPGVLSVTSMTPCWRQTETRKRTQNVYSSVKKKRERKKSISDADNLPKNKNKTKKRQWRWQPISSIFKSTTLSVEILLPLITFLWTVPNSRRPIFDSNLRRLVPLVLLTLETEQHAIIPAFACDWRTAAERRVIIPLLNNYGFFYPPFPRRAIWRMLTDRRVIIPLQNRFLFSPANPCRDLTDVEKRVILPLRSICFKS